MKQTLRLITTYKCNRNCIGCCNKQENFLPDKIKTITSLEGYNEIILTGGEPMLFQRNLYALIQSLRWLCGKQHQKDTPKIILYTALFDLQKETYNILSNLDGLTYTLHNQDQLFEFHLLDGIVYNTNFSNFSLRLNIFKKVSCPIYKTPWKVKDNIEWIDNCPLPKNEEIRKLKQLW